MLKGVIFSLNNVLASEGPIDQELFQDTIRLLRFLLRNDIKPVFLNNHQWNVTNRSTGKTRPFQQVLEEEVGPLTFYTAFHGDVEFKPKAGAVKSVLSNENLHPREAIFVGNSDVDMKAAVNGDILFLNAIWHSKETAYGYQFTSPVDVARFIDCFCLRLDSWFWQIEAEPLRVYAMGPFTTLSPKYSEAHGYSAHARSTAKSGSGDATFWGRLLALRLYTSGIVDEIDFITSYPGHSPQSEHTVIYEALKILAGSLRRKYLPDLILRHKAALKSQTARQKHVPVNINNQISSICLNTNPQKGPDKPPYASNPLKTSKTILVVDDFCTNGNSFEAARCMIEAANSNAICVSWLKTINTEYYARFGGNPVKNPYKALEYTSDVKVLPYSYHANIYNGKVSTNLADLYEGYQKWDWPKDK